MPGADAYDNEMYYLLKQSDAMKNSATSHAYSTASYYLRDWSSRQVNRPDTDIVSPWREALSVDEVAILISALNLSTSERLLQRVIRELNIAWQTKTHEYASVYPNPPILDVSGTAIYFMKSSALHNI